VITRIVFAGGAQVEVPLDVEQVKDALEREGQGPRLCEFDLAQHDGGGSPVRIYINRDQVAFITDAESPQRPVAEPPDDELREESSAGEREAGKQPVTDLWGNPIRPRRRRRG
jgi:hypothetical protein